MNLLHQIQDKIIPWENISQRLSLWKTQETRIVFTNGCFDLLHYGHIHYLAQAKALGTHLVVGLNSDQSVSRLKGKHRPIKEEQNRALILAALLCVDAVILFPEDTPLSLIHEVKPDILVKGGDWPPEQIVGYEFVTSYGGQVLSLDFIEGYSTTSLEKKIKKSVED